MHHLKRFFPGLESVLFRTLSNRCRVPDKFSRYDRTKVTNLCADGANYGLTLGQWILIYALSLVLFGVCNSGQFESDRVIAPTF
jgi:hypothetical protein